MIKAVYPGSFDPLTLGHLDIIVRASKMFDLTVGVANNASKNYLFSNIDRMYHVGKVLEDAKLEVTVSLVPGLLAQFCRENDITVIVRGLRNSMDFEYEFDMAHVNSDLGKLETVFLPANGSQTHISSSVVRQLAQLGADYTPYVPKVIDKALQARFANGKS
jgi:pantetheine-phosphate adenylyltransferase